MRCVWRWTFLSKKGSGVFIFEEAGQRLPTPFLPTPFFDPFSQEGGEPSAAGKGAASGFFTARATLL